MYRDIEDNEDENLNNSVLKLKSSLARSNEVEPGDVLPAKQKLKSIGYYEKPEYGMTPYPDEPLFQGIERFQKDQGLTVDGIMKPSGETESKVNEVWKQQYGEGRLNSSLLNKPELKQSSPSPKAEKSLFAPFTPKKVTLSNNGFSQDYNLRRKNLLSDKPGMTPDDEKRDIINRTAKILKEPTHEGYVDYLYCDSAGKISTGTGHNIDRKADFDEVNLYHPNKPEMTPLERDSYYKSMKKICAEDLAKGELDKYGKKRKNNRIASSYKNATPLRIKEEESDRRMHEHLERNYNKLKTDFPTFNEAPPSAKLVLMNHKYMLRDKFNAEIWGGLGDALLAHKYDEAAGEVSISTTSSARNEWSRKQMLEAEKEWQQRQRKK